MIISFTLLNLEIVSWYKYGFFNNATSSPFDELRINNAGEYFESGFREPCRKACPNFGENLKIIALVASAPENYTARMGIRQTWGHFTNRKDVSIAFLMGTTNNTDVNKQLVKESALYSDVIFANFHENYVNLTLKTIAMLQWVSEYCPKAKFLFKVDDDMFINMPRLLDFVNEHIEDTNSIFGKLAHGWPPVRNINVKYFISETRYSPEVYPDFVTGGSYLLPASLARSLYEASLKQQFLKLEDVFLTGFVADSLNIKRVHVPGITNDILRKKHDVCFIRHVISLHQVQFHEQFDLWTKLMDRQVICDTPSRSSAIGVWATSGYAELSIIQLGIIVLFLISHPSC